VIQEWLTKVSCAKTTADLEKALESANILEASVEMGGREQLIAKLNEIAEDKRMVTTSKLKRRVSRLVNSLQSLVTQVASFNAAAAELNQEERPAPTKKARLAPPSAEPSGATAFEDLFTRIEDIYSRNKFNDLIDILPFIDINSGNSGQRRKLKRTFEKLLKEQGGSLDESLTERIKVLIDSKVEPTSATETSQSSTVVAPAMIRAEPAVVHVKPEGHLYIVFIGQLSFGTTAQHVEDFLRGRGIEGLITVRMLTNRGTGSSKGQCFVELEGSRELKKCLRLDQHELDGRRLNIELSTGKKKAKH
jgi:hypothetical protein